MEHSKPVAVRAVALPAEAVRAAGAAGVAEALASEDEGLAASAVLQPLNATT